MRLAVATTSCAITAALALLCLTSAPAAEVPLVNGDFEDPALTAEHLPVGWHNPDTGLQPTPNLYRQSLLVHGGRYAAAISDNDNQGYSLQSRLYPALPGQKYTAGAWVYNGTGDGWLYLEFYASPWQRVSEKHAGCGQTGSWQRITLSETCPAEAKYVAVLLYSAVANTGDAAWDDVTLAGPAGDGAAVNLDKSQEAVKLDYSYLYNVGDRKQLLFDDAFFSQHERFWWRVCPPKKTGEHNLVADKPWENFIINWFTVRQDGGKYRMWYEAYDKAAAGDDQARYCYAESKDGIHWVKPVLGLVEYGGSKANNILFDHLGGAPEHGGTVFKDPMAPPQQRYKFIYLSADQERKHWTVWGATSPDGLHWQRHDAGPILNVGSDTQTVAFWDESLSKYVTYCRLWTHSRTIGRSESADFFKFPEAAEVMRCDELDPPDTDLYNNAALKYPYADHAYLIFTSLYHHPSDNLDIQLAVSRDGVHWSRPERKPFIANGPPGSMDDATAYMAPGLVRQGDELSQYYFAARSRHNQVYPQWTDHANTYTRVTLPLDRYVALDASAMPATFTTYPLTFSGSHLEINADVRARGFVRFELQDEAGKALPGYALADCTPLQGDSLRHVVRWKDGADLAALVGKPVRLHCEARDASLYAFGFARP